MIFNNSKYNNDWEIKPLNALGIFSRGKSKHRPRNDEVLFKNGKYPFIQTGNIKAADLFIRNHQENYNEIGLKQSKLWKTNTLCITIAANIAETALLGYPMCFPDSVVGFNASIEKSSEIFMHYIFTYIKKNIQNSASGSIQDNINIEYLTGLKFRIPEKKYQDQIASVLSALDAKIELNNRINAELEKMAKTLYDYWFVQFDFPGKNGKPYKSSGGKMVWSEELKRKIPKAWSVEQISDSCRVVDCLHSKKPEYYYENEVYYLLQLNNLREDNLLDTKNKYYVAKADYKKWTSRIEVQDGDILLTNAGRVASMAQVQKGVLTGIGRNITAIRPESIDPTYLGYFFKGGDMLRQIQANTDTGSFFCSFNVYAIKKLYLLRASEDIENQFVQLAEPLRRKREVIISENQKLTELRDWLLPMLMNGQVRVES